MNNAHAYSTANAEQPRFYDTPSGYAKAQDNKGGIIQQNEYDEVTVSSVPDITSGYQGTMRMGLNKFRHFDDDLCSISFIESDRYHGGQDTHNLSNKQEIHDLYCPTCTFYFTKTVLPRKAISPDVPTGEVWVPMLGNQGPPLGHRREGVDVIKAIVYGGLLESIASLSIIVSAAGGDATTLNIVTLGLANVFGGLLVLANDLMTLKELTGQQYEDQLGQPKHFVMHATIAVISYLVFGLMSPLIYGVSFYKSDDKYLKLAALAAYSFVCITILSTGKAYGQRPPKAYSKTVFYYISLTVTVSGIAYVVGNLISILLKRLSVFEPATSIGTTLLAARTVKGEWSSY